MAKNTIVSILSDDIVDICLLDEAEVNKYKKYYTPTKIVMRTIYNKLYEGTNKLKSDDLCFSAITSDGYGAWARNNGLKIGAESTIRQYATTADSQTLARDWQASGFSEPGVVALVLLSSKECEIDDGKFIEYGFASRDKIAESLRKSLGNERVYVSPYIVPTNIMTESRVTALSSSYNSDDFDNELEEIFTLDEEDQIYDLAAEYWCIPIVIVPGNAPEINLRNYYLVKQWRHVYNMGCINKILAETDSDFCCLIDYIVPAPVLVKMCNFMAGCSIEENPYAPYDCSDIVYLMKKISRSSKQCIISTITDLEEVYSEKILRMKNRPDVALAQIMRLISTAVSSSCENTVVTVAIEDDPQQVKLFNISILNIRTDDASDENVEEIKKKAQDNPAIVVKMLKHQNYLYGRHVESVQSLEEFIKLL